MKQLKVTTDLSPDSNSGTTDLMSECLHYQVSSSPHTLLLFRSSEGVSDNWDEHVRLKSGNGNSPRYTYILNISFNQSTVFLSGL